MEANDLIVVKEEVELELIETLRQVFDEFHAKTGFSVSGVAASFASRRDDDDGIFFDIESLNLELTDVTGEHTIDRIE
jgi:hypothetical protein